MTYPYCQTSKRQQLRRAWIGRFGVTVGHDGACRGYAVRAACHVWYTCRPFKARMIEAFAVLGKGTKHDRHMAIAGYRGRRLQAGPFPLP